VSSIAAGHLVAGRYELLRLLGRGSMGQVWVAHDRALGENLALKLLSSTLGGDAFEDGGTASARFRFEARIAARLSRKTRHIVAVTDYGEEDGVAFLAMELLEGQSLEQRLMHRGPMSPGEVAEVVTQIARALEQAHADGVVHRDLKPANVFLTRDEDGVLLVKLLDFGIARATHRMRTVPIFATANGIVFGTPGYMSPEQLGALKVDVRCDLWALATVAYEALTGELPVPGVQTDELLANLAARRFVPVHARDPGLPPGLDAFFARGFARHLEQRFENATEVAQAFQRAIDARAFAPTVPAATFSKPRTPRALVPSVLALGALVVLTAAWGVRARPRGPNTPPASTQDQPTVREVAPAFTVLAPEPAEPSASVDGVPIAPTAEAHAGRPRPAARPLATKTSPSTTASAAQSLPAPAISSSPAPAPPTAPAASDRSAVL
jgi:serine/threonine-protein kinase